jgi:hypothetical protein
MLGSKMEVKYPLTIIYPAGAPIAAPEHWRRLPDGRIEATYHNEQELFWSVTLSLMLKEQATDPGPGQPRQAELFHVERGGAAYEL